MLVRCPACRARVSREAQNCPKCGHPVADHFKLKSLESEAGHDSPGRAIVGTLQDISDPGGDSPRRARDIPGSTAAALVLLLVMGLEGWAALLSATPSQPARMPASVNIFNVVLALGLLLGKPWFRGFGLFRALLGAVIGPLLVVANTTPGTEFTPSVMAIRIASQIVFSLGLGLLLWDPPSPGRLRAGHILCGVLLVCETGLCLAMATGGVDRWIRPLATRDRISQAFGDTQSPAVQDTVASPSGEVGDGHAPLSEVREALASWHRAIVAGDLDGDMAHYAPSVNYFTKGIVSRDRIRQDRSRFYSGTDREISWSDPSIEWRAPIVAVIEEVEFSMRRRRRYAARVRVELLWERRGDEWKIVSQQELEVIWTRRGALNDHPPLSDPGAADRDLLQVPEVANTHTNRRNDAHERPGEPVGDPPLAPLPHPVDVEVSGGHWIDSVSGNGKIIELEDGSIWEVCPIDQVTTVLWLTASDIVVLEGSNAHFPYKLVNKDDGETAEARVLRGPGR